MASAGGVAMVALFAIWVAADRFHHASIAAFAAVALVVMLIASD
jgi:hypothetical protein